MEAAGLFSIGYYAYYEKYGTPPKSIHYNKMTHIAIGAVSLSSSGSIIVENYVDNLSLLAFSFTLVSLFILIKNIWQHGYHL